MKKIILTAALIVGLTTACAAKSATDTSDTPATGTNAPSSSAAETPAAGTNTASESVDTPSSEPESSNKSFGDTVTFDGGVQITIGKPFKVTPSQYAAVKKSPGYIAFKITVVNTGTENYDPSTFYTTMQSGDTEADEIFDSQRGFEGSPSTKILPGRQGTFKIGYGVQNPKDLVLEVTPGFEYESVIYATS